MTVSSTTRKAGPFAGNGVATTFPFSFKVFAKTDIGLFLSQGLAAGQQLTLDSDYSVTLNADQNNNPGGTITYPISGDPMPAGYSLNVLGTLPYTQPTDITNGGGFYPSVIEDALDRTEIQIQQLAEITARALQFPAADSASPMLGSAGNRANTVLAFDSNGNAISLPVPASVGAGDLRNESWTAGTDYTKSTSTVVQLSRAYGTKANLGTVVMDGLGQDPSTYQLTNGGSTLQFDAPIPANRVWCVGGTTLSVLLPAIASIIDAMIAPGTKLYNRIGGLIDVKDPAYGAKCDGITDDTLAVQTAFNAAASTGFPVLLGKNSKITAPLTPPAQIRVIGAGAGLPSLVASGNFDAVVLFGASAAAIEFEYVTISTAGTTTKCLDFAQGSQVNKFSKCAFTGDLNGNLIYSQAAGYITYNDCVFNCNSANTNAVYLDGFNQNTEFNGGHAGGPGTFLRIANSTGNIANNVQGTKCNQFTSICTGANPIVIGGQAFANFFNQCIIDQAGLNCIVIEDGSSITQINGGYYGLAASAGPSGVPILLTANAGAGTQINGAQTYGGGSAIQAIANGTSRVSYLTIANCVFMSATGSTLQFDSVANCIITGNTDLSNPSFGSLSTTATFGAGSYAFDNNTWNPNAIANFHAGSSYKFGYDRGVTGRNTGVAANSVATSSFTVDHGLLAAPTKVTLTPQGNAGNFSWSNPTPTQFQINWTSGATVPAGWTWEASV